MDTNLLEEPLLNKISELIIEDRLQGDDVLIAKMVEDVARMKSETKSLILKAMLKMHKYFEDYCGDLDVSLNSIEEIRDNTTPWYIILDESSEMERRAVRYHYKCNWETGHGVEVIVLNGNDALFVGNCGYASSIQRVLDQKEEEYNYIERA